MPDEPAWLSVRAYGQRYGFTRQTVYKYRDEGFLVTFQVGRLLRIKNQLPRRGAARREHEFPVTEATRKSRVKRTA